MFTLLTTQDGEKILFDKDKTFRINLIFLIVSKSIYKYFLPRKPLLKMCPYSEISSLHFLVFGLNMEKYPVSFCIYSKFQKIWTRKTKNTDAFYAVNGVATTAMVQQVSVWLTSVSKSRLRKSKKNQAIQETPKTLQKILATFLFLFSYSQLAIHI